MLKERGITIKEALEMECLKKCKLIAGFGGYNNIITRVNIMADFEILNWVSEGELLLTTAYFFKVTSLEEQIDFIHQLHKKKLSGIAVKIYPYLDRLPTEVIDTANELKFPIIELNYQIPFTDIMTPIFKEIFNKQASLLQKVENLHNELMNIILKGGSIRDIIGTLSRNIGNPILIKNHYFEEFICCESLFDFDYEELKIKIDEFFNRNTINLCLFSNYKTNIKFHGKTYNITFVPIVLKSSVYGHIGVLSLNKKISNFDIVSIETASMVIAVECLKRISVEEVENNYKAEFFQDLISYDNSRKNKAIEKANYYKLDKNACYNIVSISLDETKSDLKNKYDLNQYKNKIIHLINRICLEEKMIFLVTSKGNTINVLLMWKNGEKLKKKINSLVRKIDKGIYDRMSFIKYIIGIGRAYKGLQNVYKSLKDSEKAVEAGKTFINDKIIDFDKLGIYKILCQDNLKDELITFFNSTLLPLCEYDKEKDTELVKTLEVYFETNGNLKKMSEILYTHYNTILYRINRIRHITDMDLDNEHDRFNLEIALKIKKILGIDI